MTDDELREIEERLSKVTPYPWEWYYPDPPERALEITDSMSEQEVKEAEELKSNLPQAILLRKEGAQNFNEWSVMTAKHDLPNKEDADLIANAPTDISALLAALKERDAEVKRLRLQLTIDLKSERFYEDD